MNLLGFSQGFNGGYSSKGKELSERMEKKRKRETKSFRMTAIIMLAGLGVLGLVTWLLIG